MITTAAKLKEKLSSPYALYLFFVISIYLLFFEEPMAWLDIPVASVFRNILPVAAVLVFLRHFFNTERPLRSLLSPYLICGAVFAVSGFAGGIIYRYQNTSITLIALYEHIRFWLCLYLFLQTGKRFPFRQYANRLFYHIAALAAFIGVLVALDTPLHIWPRQMIRYGTSSIQLFFGHPSNFGVRPVFLTVMLVFLYPYLRKQSEKISRACIINLILTVVMLGDTLQTLRVRLFGYVLIFAVLYLVMIVFKKRLHFPVLLAGAAGALAIGWKRLYGFYFSPYAYTMARGRFAVNSLDIARRTMPLGAGFGSFGSRMAQVHYSPLYIKYGMNFIAGLSPDHPNYACDTFFPMILGESGWLGFAAYIGLLVLLIISVFRFQSASDGSSISRHAVFISFMLIIYELLEATGTLSFSETYAVLIALVLGLALSRQFASDPATSDK